MLDGRRFAFHSVARHTVLAIHERVRDVGRQGLGYDVTHSTHRIRTMGVTGGQRFDRFGIVTREARCSIGEAVRSDRHINRFFVAHRAHRNGAVSVTLGKQQRRLVAVTIAAVLTIGKWMRQKWRGGRRRIVAGQAR